MASMGRAGACGSSRSHTRAAADSATPAGAWMAEHAWEFGFVMSYPRGSFAQTCYDYESWHYRYVGRALAADIRASGLTPREFLWRLQ